MAAVELSSSPSLRTLYPRAVLGAGLSVLRRLPGPAQAPRDLPSQELVISDVAVDPERLAAYQRVCTFEVGDALPVTYPHLLAFPLSMKLMTGADFPFPVVGLVHVRNRITQLRPIAASERPTVTVRLQGLAPHERGTQFEVIAEAAVSGEVVWRSASTYLHRERSGGSGKERERTEPPQPSVQFSVPSDIGRRYAAVSGDRNPIHLHPLAARLFGLPRHIAHGMWAKARCLAILGPEVPDRCAIDVSFKLPLLLPARVAMAWWTEDGGRGFALNDGASGKPHLSGTVAPA